MEASSPPRYLHQVVGATALVHVALALVVVAVAVGAAVFAVGVVAAVKSSASGSIVFAS